MLFGQQTGSILTVAHALLVSGSFCSKAIAMEGHLIVPDQVKSPVVFEMQKSTADDPTADIDSSDILKVFVGSSEVCCDNKSPVAGTYTLDERTITFFPAFDFLQGQDYTVEVSDNNAATAETRYVKQFRIEHTVDQSRPEIVAIFPSADDIPANTLRFYIHFSMPMKPHVSSDYIKLLDASGTSDNAAFMAFKQELWSEDRQRLTLLMDPGRIKRGVAQNLTLGPALQEGRTYSIVIDEGWQTANHELEMPRFEHEFTVSKPLRTMPDPNSWATTTPGYLTNEPLIIEFDRSFDHELLQRGIQVLDGEGKPVPGAASIGKQERSWRFDRKGLWSEHQVQIILDPALEDVAGNNFIELLDHSVGTQPSGKPQKIISLDLKPFTDHYR